MDINRIFVFQSRIIFILMNIWLVITFQKRFTCQLTVNGTFVKSCGVRKRLMTSFFSSICKLGAHDLFYFKWIFYLQPKNYINTINWTKGKNIEKSLNNMSMFVHSYKTLKLTNTFFRKLQCIYFTAKNLDY